MEIQKLLKNKTEEYKKEYVNRFKKGDLASNVMAVSELQLNLSEELKIISESIYHEQLIKDLHKDFIDFATNY